MNSNLNRLKRLESIAVRSTKAEDEKSKLDIGRLSLEEVKELLETKMQAVRDNGFFSSFENCSRKEIAEILEEKLYRLRLKNRGKNLIGVYPPTHYLSSRAQ